MVEQWTHKPLVGGSNPPLAIKIIQTKIPCYSGDFLVVKVPGKRKPYARWRFEQAIRPASRMLAFYFKLL